MFQAYTDLILRDRPSLYWRAEETSGTTVGDLTPNRNNGTVAGGMTLDQDGLLEFDRSRALDFDGVNGRVGSSYAPYVNGTIRTFEGWASRDADATIDTLVGSSNGTPSNVVWLRISASSTTVLFSTNGGTNNATWTSAWPGNGVRVHWVVIFDEASDTAELYVNGASKGTVAYTIAYSATPGDFVLGATIATVQPFDGKMDEIAVYERALTPAEIQAHYEAGSKVGG